MNVYRKYIIVDYNKLGINAKFLMSFRTTITTNGSVRLLGVKIEGRKGIDEKYFKFYTTPETYPDIGLYSFCNPSSMTSKCEIKFSEKLFNEMYIGKYDIYDATPKLLFEIGD